MKRLTPIIPAAALFAAFAITAGLNGADAQQKKEIKPVTVTGTSACAQCQGSISGHDVMLFLNSEKGQKKQGMRIVLTGSGPDYKKAHKVRKDGKKMTALLEGPIQAKKDQDGELYLQARVAEIKMGA